MALLKPVQLTIDLTNIPTLDGDNTFVGSNAFEGINATGLTINNGNGASAVFCDDNGNTTFNGGSVIADGGTFGVITGVDTANITTINDLANIQSIGELNFNGAVLIGVNTVTVTDAFGSVDALNINSGSGDITLNSTSNITLNASGGEINFGNANLQSIQDLSINGTLSAGSFGDSITVGGLTIGGSTFAAGGDYTFSNGDLYIFDCGALVSLRSLDVRSTLGESGTLFGKGGITGAPPNDGNDATDLGVIGATGGAASDEGTAGRGAGVTLLSGAGGDGSSMQTGGDGGNIIIQSGAAGSDEGAGSGSNGSIYLYVASSLIATINSAGISSTGNIAGTSYSGSGAGLSSLNASNVSSGTLADARLSSNVPLKNVANTFSASQSVTGSFIASKFISSGVWALTDNANIVTDASNGNLFTVTIGNAVGASRNMSAPVNAVSGQEITYRIKQDATGSRTITWNSGTGGFRFSGGTAPTLTTTAAKTDYVTFVYNAADLKWDYRYSTLNL